MAARIGANFISPWPGPRRFGSFTCTCAIVAGGHPALDQQSGTGSLSAWPAALQSIIVRRPGEPIASTMRAASATVLTKSVSRARQRLDAIDDAGLRRGARRRARRQSRARAQACSRVLARRHRALLRRAVHEVACRPARAHSSTSRVITSTRARRAAPRRRSTIDRPAGATSSQCRPVIARPCVFDDAAERARLARR